MVSFFLLNRVGDFYVRWFGYWFTSCKGSRQLSLDGFSPRKVTTENAEELKNAREQRKRDNRERIPIEGKFGQGKNGYRLSYVRARYQRTSEAWINWIGLDQI